MKSLKRFTVLGLYSLLLTALTACNMPAKPTTSASSASMLTVREATNCRAGPGTEYDIVFTYPSGTKLQIRGHYEPGDFWQVKSDKSPTGSCWMWGGSVDVAVTPQAAASATPPSASLPTSTSTNATSTPAGLRALSIVNWEYSCSNGTLIFTVIWKSRLTDETGYRIFRNGEQIVELPAGSTTYTDKVSAGQSLEYYIQVYGLSGAANSSVMKAEC